VRAYRLCYNAAPSRSCASEASSERPVDSCRLTGYIQLLAVFPKLQAPRLSVVGIEFQKGALWQQKLKVRMHVENPTTARSRSRESPTRSTSMAKRFAHVNRLRVFVVPALGQGGIRPEHDANMAGHAHQPPQPRSRFERGLPPHGEDLAVGRAAASVSFDQHGTFKLAVTLTRAASRRGCTYCSP